MVEAQLYVVRAHTRGFYTHPMQVVDSSSLIGITLPVRGYEILSAYPLRGFVSPAYASTIWIAAFGLLGKMAGAAAVLSTTMTMGDTGKISIECAVKALGTMGFYISALPELSLEKNLIATILGKVVPLSCVKAVDMLLEIDAAKAWTEMGLDGGWSNEVKVQVFVNPS